jgi:acetylglutamate kinase
VTDLSTFAGRWFVVKIGGELLADPRSLASGIGQSVRELSAAKIKIAIVHGGGPQATQLSQRLGLRAIKVGGRRVTDAETLEVMKMALAGQASVDLSAALGRAGVRTIATTGVSARLIEAQRRSPVVVSGGGREPVDFGWVGDVVRVNVELLEQLAGIPVVIALASLAADGEGNVFNINADTVAARVASALQAARLFLVSQVPGVLEDISDPGTRIPRLSRKAAAAQISSGVIHGGMIPKVEAGLAALEAGVESVHVVATQPADVLLRESISPGSCGTVLVRD